MDIFMSVYVELHISPRVSHECSKTFRDNEANVLNQNMYQY
jgi:hypothetical protein